MTKGRTRSVYFLIRPTISNNRMVDAIDVTYSFISSLSLAAQMKSLIDKPLIACVEYRTLQVL